MGKVVAAAFLLLMLAPLPLAAQCDIVDMTARVSIDALGDADNEVIQLDYSATGCLGGVTDILWTDVELAAFDPSWGSEAQVQASASNLSSAEVIQPFPGEELPGVFGPASGSLGTGVTLLGDNILRLEWFESFDDDPGNPDAEWLGGLLEVVPVELQSFSVD